MPQACRFVSPSPSCHSSVESVWWMPPARDGMHPSFVVAAILSRTFQPLVMRLPAPRPRVLVRLPSSDPTSPLSRLDTALGGVGSAVSSPARFAAVPGPSSPFATAFGSAPPGAAPTLDTPLGPAPSPQNSSRSARSAADTHSNFCARDPAVALLDRPDGVFQRVVGSGQFWHIILEIFRIENGQVAEIWGAGTLRRPTS